MTPEEYQRLKEAEKEHLRKLKEIKKAAHNLRHQRRVTQAMTELGTSTQGVLDKHAEAVEKLDQETVLNEARTEMAFDAIAEREAREAVDAATEEELRKARAEALIRQMKLQMGSPDADVQASTTKPHEAADEPPEATSNDLPEKTIGRMKP